MQSHFAQRRRLGRVPGTLHRQDTQSKACRSREVHRGARILHLPQGHLPCFPGGPAPSHYGNGEAPSLHVQAVRLEPIKCPGYRREFSGQEVHMVCCGCSW